MSALISNLSELTALLVQSFNLSALFPSLAFVLMNYVFVRPMLRHTAFYAALDGSDKSIQAVVLATVVVGIAYFLTAINHPITRFFEGYPLINRYPFDKWYQRNLQEVRNLRERIDTLTAEIDHLDKEALAKPLRQRQATREKQESLKAQKQHLIEEQLLRYPISENRVLPTPLGNVIAAAEDYPEQLFGMDSVLFWPYLVPILTETGYSKYVEREKAIFDLLMNSTVLVAVLAVEIGYLGAYLEDATWRWLVNIILLGGAAAVLYLLMPSGAMGWGLTIRVAFVLYRHKLRESLSLVRPNSYEEEFDLWKEASQFYREPGRAIGLGPSPNLFEYKSGVQNSGVPGSKQA